MTDIDFYLVWHHLRPVRRHHQHVGRGWRGRERGKLVSFAFVCAKDDDESPVDEHQTTGVMRQFDRCTKWAVAGYMCECGHEDIDPTDQLTGHDPEDDREHTDKATLDGDIRWVVYGSTMAAKR